MQIKMKNYLKWMKGKLTIIQKLVLAYIFLILLPASLLLYSYYRNSSAVIEKEVTHSILQSLKQAAINITYRLESVKDASNALLMNPDLHTYLDGNKRNNTVGQQIEDAKELRKIIGTAQDNRDVFRIRLFVNPSKIYASENVNFFSLEDIDRTEWYPSVIEQNGRIYWKSTSKERYLDSEENYVISCSRLLRNSENYDETTGILMVDILEKNVFEILSEIDLPRKESIFILDPEGKVVSHFDKANIGKTVLKEEEIRSVGYNPEGIDSFIREKDKVFFIYTTINETGWKIVAQIYADDITGRNSIFNKISGVVAIVILMVVFLLAVFLIFGFAAEGMRRRIKQVVGMIEQEGLENFQGDPLSYKGDIYQLKYSVNSMINTVKKLMEESYRSKISEREAQLKALQAQINPHFLYNTLDAINWMAIQREAEDISFMLDSLAKYFRLSLNKGKDVVTVEDELNLARVYLEIQGVRFEKSFTAEFDIDAAVNGYAIPKLVLQPVIENALLHGIQKKKTRRGTITVEARKEEECLVLTVSDDGVGMDKEKLEQLTKYSNSNSYGLYNVNERIKLFCGENYGISVFSEKDKGTSVEIRLVALKEFNTI